MSRRTSVVLVVAGVGIVVVALVLSLLVSGGEESEPSAAPSTSATPQEPPTVALADLDTLATAVTRDTFCDGVAPEAVEDALGATPTTTSEYADGESVQVTGRVRDIAHEYGCAWTTSTVAARAWIFAPPVTRRLATSLVRDARREDGCRPVSGAPDFGSPSVALSCRTSRGVQASYRGLLGDAWVTCAVADRGVGRSAEATEVTEVVERAERWCVAVLAAAAG